MIYQIHPKERYKKLIYQIGTADPDRAVMAARIVAPDVAGIDVNAGCPKPFSTSGGMGAALLKTPDKLCAILEALVKNITSEFQIGISVKIRILETAEQTEALVRRLCTTGITALTVHCRTTSMRPRERAIRDQLKMIGQVCREAGVACLMNGDVKNRDQANRLVKDYGVDGAMIATAAEKNPSCFRSADEGGLLLWPEVVEKYVEVAMSTHNKLGNTKFLLNNMIPGKWHNFTDLSRSKSYTQVIKLLGLAQLETIAREIDMKLGIDHGIGRQKPDMAKKHIHDSEQSIQTTSAKVHISQIKKKECLTSSQSEVE